MSCDDEERMTKKRTCPLYLRINFYHRVRKKEEEGCEEEEDSHHDWSKRRGPLGLAKSDFIYLGNFGN